jgi:NADPH:quinone reductase-like Zn-dependent oxidoreductase
MKAVQFHETGGAEVLRYEEVPDPVPGPGEAVVRVRAAALNHLDVFLRSGLSRMPGFKLPHIGGFDISGEVARVGPDVEPSLLGKPVVVNARVTGPQAHGKLDLIGTARPGGFAEQVLVPADRLAPKPAAYSFEEAAAFGCVYITAYYGLVLNAAVRPGEFVLVHAAGSGAGMAAIQVAKTAGAVVIGTAGSDEKCAKAKECLHADHAINYRTQDLVSAVRGITGGGGVQVVFDPVWGEAAEKTQKCLALRGRWIVLGMVGGLRATLDAAVLMFQEITLRGIVEFYADDAQLEAAWGLAHRGLVRPIIDKVWPLAKLADAQRQMERGDVFGKIVVTP